jgi:hypothetical protein
MKRLTRALVLALSSLLLSACLGDMPSSGPIGLGRENSVAPDSNIVRTIVSPPQPGADPVGIVRGFMAAAAGDSSTFSTARLYLAPEVRAEWRPQAEIRVVSDRGSSWDYDNIRLPGLVRFAGTGVARINSFGEFQPDSEQVITEFRLRLVNQEWRISEVPDGLTLSESELGRAYRPVSLYFPDRTRSILVPNPVYLPVRPALATAMVRALLRGPTPWLRPSVRSAFPSGVALQVNAVPVVDGVASVDLSENVARASSVEQSLMSAQIVHTLRQVAEISAVRITAGGVPLAVQGVPNPQPVTAWSGLAPDAPNSDGLIYFSTDSGLASLSLASGASQARPFASSVADYTRGLRLPSISHERDRLIALDAGGNVVAAELTSGAGGEVEVNGLTTVLSARGRDFVRPRWDISATYWIAARGTASLRAYAGRIGSGPVQVEVPAWGSGVITAFAVSRDGARVAVARSGDGRSRVYLMRVVVSGRGDDLRYAVEEPQLLGSFYGTVTDLSWSGAAQVVLLAGVPGQQRQIWGIGIDGSTAIALGPPLLAISVAAAPGRSVLAELSDHRLVILRDQRWSEITTGRDPAYSG